jgi:hypothetical protein
MANALLGKGMEFRRAAALAETRRRVFRTRRQTFGHLTAVGARTLSAVSVLRGPLAAVAARVEIIVHILDVGDLAGERFGVAHFEFGIDRTV